MLHLSGRSKDRKGSISAGTARHLVSKFGTASQDVLALNAEDRSLADSIVEGYPAIRAEVIYSVWRGMAATIEDALARRIGLQPCPGAWRSTQRQRLVF